MHARRTAAALAAVLVGAALTGCASEGPGGAPASSPPPTTEEPLVTPSAPSPGPTPEPTPTPTTGPATDGSPAEVAAADLASRLGIAVDEVLVVRSDAVTWRDGSLGCPRPGMAYTQALVEGTLVLLEADGRQYEYHAGGRRAPFLCENPQPPVGDVS